MSRFIDPTPQMRRSLRLPAYNYAGQGYYFVTLCTHKRQPIFGKLSAGGLVPSKVGEVAIACWMDIPSHFSDVAIDAFVLMPDHIHGIILIEVDAPKVSRTMRDHRPTGAASRSLGAIIGSYKAAVSKRTNAMQGGQIFTLWQRNYFERIVRNDAELSAARVYIEQNPFRDLDGDDFGPWR